MIFNEKHAVTVIVLLFTPSNTSFVSGGFQDFSLCFFPDMILLYGHSDGERYICFEVLELVAVICF